MQKSTQFSLLIERRFGPFFWTQFLGAFNDNVFKTALLTTLTFEALLWTTVDTGLLNNLLPGLFILPFVLFSALAGQLADKFDKARLSRLVKLMEVAIMLIACLGWLQHQLWLLVLALVGMGLHSTLFGPVKYAYIPQVLRRDELIGANGVVEMGTFVGILLGEIIGASLVLQKPWGTELVAGGTLAIALLGWACSRAIPAAPAPAADLQINWHLWRETLRNLRLSRQNRPVWLALIGNSWFWFYGAILLAQFPLYAKLHLHGDHSVFILLLAIFSLGIGLGSLMCERLSGRRIELGLVPLGALGMTVFGAELYFASQAYSALVLVDARGFLLQSGSWRILFDLVALGIFGGIYIVPLFALIQTRCDAAHLSRTIAGMNIMNALFMVGSAGVAMASLSFGCTIPQIFLIAALMNGLMTGWIFYREPSFLARFWLWIRGRAAPVF